MVQAGLVALALVAAALAALTGLRLFDLRADRAAIARLRASGPVDPPRFDPAMVAGLPEPARHYFTFTIAPGTALRTVAEIEMGGTLGFGTKGDPGYRPMRARQVLSPQGFVWQVRSGIMSGTDALTLPDRSWSRFRIFRLLPVGRASGADHRRSSYGRMVAESVFWTPAALLPGEGVAWSAVDADTARVRVARGALSVEVDVTVDETGQPRAIRLMRWSNANPDGVFRLQPFGGTPSQFRDVDGFRLPMRVEGGNFFGTDAYFPFFRAEVSEITLAD